MGVKKIATCAVLMVTIAAGAAAQPRTADPKKRGLNAGDLPRIVKITNNVYGFEGTHPSGMPTVSLIVVGTDGVLVADGQANPEQTQMMLDAIAKVTTKPVRWYVVGSDHGDHTGGNSVLPKDITFIASAASKAQMERDAKRRRRRVLYPRPRWPATSRSSTSAAPRCGCSISAARTRAAI